MLCSAGSHVGSAEPAAPGAPGLSVAGLSSRDPEPLPGDGGSAGCRVETGVS